MWTSYYYLQEALKYQKPKTVVLEVYGTKLSELNDETKNRKVFDDMKFSKEKIDSIKQSINKDEDMLSYIFPIIRYHDRWRDLSKKDFTYPLSDKNFIYKGHWIHFNTVKNTNMNFYKDKGNYKIEDNVTEYMNKIVQLCNDNNIKLVLIKAPRYDWYQSNYEAVNRYAKENNLEYIDYNLFYKKLGISDETDFRDNGQHLNDKGAIKFSENIGEYLKKNQTIESKNEDIEEAWNEDYELYQQEKKTYFENQSK